MVKVATPPGGPPRVPRQPPAPPARHRTHGAARLLRAAGRGIVPPIPVRLATNAVSGAP